MIKKYLSFFTMLIILVGACSKDANNNNDPMNTDGIDTIIPLSYFPVYPGSFWKYLDSNNDTVLITTDSTYSKDAYSIGGASFISDSFYVPRYNYPGHYNHTAMWRYEAHTGPISNAGSYPLTRILSDSLPVGSSWTIYNWAGTGVNRKIIARDTIIDILGTMYHPTIAIEEYYSHGPPMYIWINRRYYTKDIGMVKEESYNYSDSTHNEKLLIEYHIQK